MRVHMHYWGEQFKHGFKHGCSSSTSLVVGPWTSLHLRAGPARSSGLPAAAGGRDGPLGTAPEGKVSGGQNKEVRKKKVVKTKKW